MVTTYVRRMNNVELTRKFQHKKFAKPVFLKCLNIFSLSLAAELSNLKLIEFLA